MVVSADGHAMLEEATAVLAATAGTAAVAVTQRTADRDRREAPAERARAVIDGFAGLRPEWRLLATVPR